MQVCYPILPSSVGVGGGGIEAHVGPPGHPVAPIMWVPLAILWPRLFVVVTELKIVVSHIARVYSKDHIVLSIADSEIEASTSARVVHTLFVARYDAVWVLFATQHCCVAWSCRCVAP